MIWGYHYFRKHPYKLKLFFFPSHSSLSPKCVRGLFVWEGFLSTAGWKIPTFSLRNGSSWSRRKRWRKVLVPFILKSWLLYPKLHLGSCFVTSDVKAVVLFDVDEKACFFGLENGGFQWIPWADLAKIGGFGGGTFLRLWCSSLWHISTQHVSW